MGRPSKKLQKIQATWSEKIARAKKVRKNWKDLFRVDLARKYLDGVQNPGYPKDEFICINKFYSHSKSQLPALYSIDPYFYIRLKRSFSPSPDDIAKWEIRAKIRQANLNYLKTKLNLKAKARMSIQDAQTSYGVCKIHYYAEEEKNPYAGNQLEHEETGFPMFDENDEPVMEPDTIPINEKYKITHIHPDDFLFDEDAGPLEDDWTWVANRQRMTLKQAKKIPAYNNAALNKLKDVASSTDQEEKNREKRKKGDVASRSDLTESSSTKTSKAAPVLAFWEIYDIENEEWFVIAEDGDVPIVEPGPTPDGIDKHPFAVLVFTPRDDSPYPNPPLSQGIDLQKEYNLTRSRMLTHRKRFNRKYEADITRLDDENELTKLTTGEDGTVIKKQGPEAVVTPIKDAPLDQTQFAELGYMDKEMVEVMGGSHDEARGLASAESATQASLLDKRMEMREGDSMSMVIDFVREIARKLDLLVQTHITTDEAIKVTGPQGEYWEMVKAQDYEEIDGEFEYTVNVGATIPRMPQMERASWQAFLAFLGNAPQFLMSKRLLKHAAEMHHVDDEMMIEEIFEIGQKMMSGKIPMSGNSGSQAGVGEQRPESAMGGMQGGQESLNQPGGGNLQ